MQKIKILFKKGLSFLPAILLIGIAVFLRVPNLGYSDYIGDEHKAFMQLFQDQTPWQFFLEQRKGPLQFLVSHIPYSITGDWHNELAQRIPFTLFGIAAVYIFYAFVEKFTKNKWIAFIAGFLFAVNGFTIGFARIAQYQNLNLFFSFSALYFYLEFLRPSKDIKILLKNTLLGTACFSLSLLAHWDAVFVLVPIIYFFIKFLKNPSFTKNQKIKIIIPNLILGLLILLPFLAPYLWNSAFNSQHQQYFGRRIALGHLNYERYQFLIELYHPFYVLEFLLVAGLLSLPFLKKNWLFLVWFGVNYSLFELFVRKPGTHIYNFVLPFLIFVAVGIFHLYKKLPKLLKLIYFAALTLLFIFFINQSYFVFIDHSVEYPWDREFIMDLLCSEEKERDRLGRLTDCGKFEEHFETKKYFIEDKAPLFGFPMYRHWDEINDWVNLQNETGGEDLGYMTNEVKTISEWYMAADYEAENSFYIVGIKRPLSFVNDWKFVQINGKKLVHEIENSGTTVVRIYRVDPK